MKLLKKKLTGIAMATITVLSLVNFTGCLSTLLEVTDELTEPIDIYEESENYSYDSFSEMFDPDNYSYNDIYNYLAEWYQEDPENPDLAKCFLELDNDAAEDSDDEDLQSSFALVEEALERDPYRLDLWEDLYKTYNNFYCYEEAETTALNFLDVAEEVEYEDGQWYDVENEEIYFDYDYEREERIVDSITKETDYWLTEEDSDEEAIESSLTILDRLLEVYPDSSSDILRNIISCLSDYDSDRLYDYESLVDDIDDEDLSDYFYDALTEDYYY